MRPSVQELSCTKNFHITSVLKGFGVIETRLWKWKLKRTREVAPFYVQELSGSWRQLWSLQFLSRGVAVHRSCSWWWGRRCISEEQDDLVDSPTKPTSGREVGESILDGNKARPLDLQEKPSSRWLVILKQEMLGVWMISKFKVAIVWRMAPLAVVLWECLERNKRIFEGKRLSILCHIW